MVCVAGSPPYSVGQYAQNVCLSPFRVCTKMSK